MSQQPPERRVFVKRTETIYRHQRERAGKAGAAPAYTLDQLRQYAAVALELPCRYCGGRLQAYDFQLDHACPLARGGEWTLANLAACCPPCNQAKGNLNAGEYGQLLALIDSWAPEARASVLQRLRSGGRVFRRKVA